MFAFYEFKIPLSTCMKSIYCSFKRALNSALEYIMMVGQMGSFFIRWEK